jgi:hypothetical protein
VGKSKELKTAKPEKSSLDIFNMVNFYIFFKELYKERPLSEGVKERAREGLSDQADPLNNTLLNLNEELNREVTVEELKGSLKRLKNGKASGLDAITNKALKASPSNLEGKKSV